MKSKIYISIDGGGIRGIIPLVILRHIQRHLDFNLNVKVDNWIGTSTGAIISAALLIQEEENFEDAIQNILDIYEFRSNSSINPLSSAHPERALHKILEDNFEMFSTDAFPNLAITVCKEINHELVIIQNNSEINLSTALKAACAVPGIFKSIKIQNENFIDGFLKAKNPTAILKNHLQPNDIVISLGTGILKEVDLIEEQVKNVHDEMKEFSAKNDIDYFRLNPRLVDASDNMQNTQLKNIFSLKKDAENYIKEKKSTFDDLIQKLNQIK